MASSSRARSSSPFSYRKPSSPYSSASSTTSYNNRLMPRSCSTSASSFFGSRSVTPSRDRSDSMHYGLSNGVGAYGGSLNPVGFGSEELIAEPIDQPRNGGDSISVTIRFRPLR
jgi:centromeric protein E